MDNLITLQEIEAVSIIIHLKNGVSQTLTARELTEFTMEAELQLPENAQVAPDDSIHLLSVPPQWIGIIHIECRRFMPDPIAHR